MKLKLCYLLPFFVFSLARANGDGFDGSYVFINGKIGAHFNIQKKWIGTSVGLAEMKLEGDDVYTLTFDNTPFNIQSGGSAKITCKIFIRQEADRTIHMNVISGENPNPKVPDKQKKGICSALTGTAKPIMIDDEPSKPDSKPLPPPKTGGDVTT